jgi:hypothetical protein
MSIAFIMKKCIQLFVGKGMELETIMLKEVSQVQENTGLFSRMWKIDPKDKHVHKYKRDHTYMICL